MTSGRVLDPVAYVFNPDAAQPTVALGASLEF